jgi:hypothetical protein
MPPIVHSVEIDRPPVSVFGLYVEYVPFIRTSGTYSAIVRRYIDVRLHAAVCRHVRR